MEWEPVLTVNEYFDGCVFGVALFRGVPHVYDSEYDAKAEEFSHFYRLAQIEDDLLKLVLEDWQIWLRWDSHYKNGLTNVESHPAFLRIAKGMRS